MNSSLMILAIGLIAVMPLAASAQTTTDKAEKKTATEKVTTATKDGWISSKTKIALYADERVHGTSVNVDTKNGVITLRGKVDSPEEKAAAAEVAKGIEGVTSVKNNLQVVPRAERKAVDRKDDDVTKAVKERLKKDARLKGSDIEVRADKGVVTLTGDVKDLGARARASEVARGVAGVKAVKNEIKEKS
jgi:hyperosmotically inducible protein